MVQEQHILEQLVEQARAFQDDEHHVAYAHDWADGVLYVQVMLIGEAVSVFTLGEMLPGVLPVVTNDLDHAKREYARLALKFEEAF